MILNVKNKSVKVLITDSKSEFELSKFDKIIFFDNNYTTEKNNIISYKSIFGNLDLFRAQERITNLTVNFKSPIMRLLISSGSYGFILFLSKVEWILIGCSKFEEKYGSNIKVKVYIHDEIIRNTILWYYLKKERSMIQLEPFLKKTYLYKEKIRPYIPFLIQKPKILKQNVLLIVIFTFTHFMTFFPIINQLKKNKEEFNVLIPYELLAPFNLTSKLKKPKIIYWLKQLEIDYLFLESFLPINSKFTEKKKIDINNERIKNVFQINNINYFNLIKNSTDIFVNKWVKRTNYNFLSAYYSFHSLNPKAVLLGNNAADWGQFFTIIAKDSKVKVYILQHGDIGHDQFFISNTKMFVNGEREKNILLQRDNVPENQIIISGQPRYEIYRNQKNILKYIQRTKDYTSYKKPYILLFLSNLYFDPFPLVGIILQFILRTDYNLIIKLHPSQDLDEYKRFVDASKSKIKVNVVKYAKLPNLILNAEFIISMPSAVVTESLVAKKAILLVDFSTRNEMIYEELIKEELVLIAKSKEDFDSKLDMIQNLAIREELIKTVINKLDFINKFNEKKAEKFIIEYIKSDSDVK